MTSELMHLSVLSVNDFQGFFLHQILFKAFAIPW